MRSEFHITEFITVLIIFAVIILIGAVIAGMVINEANRLSEGIIVDNLSEGIIVDKRFSPARFIDGSYYPSTYRFTIAGEKGDKSVRYSFSVTKDEYDRYKIGDWYKR